VRKAGCPKFGGKHFKEWPQTSKSYHSKTQTYTRPLSRPLSLPISRHYFRVFFWRLNSKYSGDRNYFFKASSVLRTRYLHSNRNADLRITFDYFNGDKTHHGLCYILVRGISTTSSFFKGFKARFI